MDLSFLPQDKALEVEGCTRHLTILCSRDHEAAETDRLIPRRRQVRGGIHLDQEARRGLAVDGQGGEGMVGLGAALEGAALGVILSRGSSPW